MKRKLAGLGLLALGLGLLVAAACSSGAAPTATPAGAAGATATKPPAGGGATVAIQGFAFSPASITVAKGTAITWTNKDSAAHTVTATDPAGAFNSGSLSSGASFSFTFTTAGTFNYVCNFHPSMKGTVVVSP